MSTPADVAPEIARHCADMKAVFEWPSHAEHTGDFRDTAHLLDALRYDLGWLTDVAEVWTPPERLVDNIERIVDRIADENRRERAELLDVSLDDEALDDWDALDVNRPTDWVAIDAADLLHELAAIRRLLAACADPAEIAEAIGRVVARLAPLVRRHARVCAVAHEAPAHDNAERGPPLSAHAVTCLLAPHAPPTSPCARPRHAHASSARCHSRKEAAAAD